MPMDLITTEIVTHRLHEITREIALTLERVGSTVNTTQMKDYIATLYAADGALVSPGPVASWHTYCAGRAVRAVIDAYGDDVSEGDMFLLNDPYVAAIHQSDLYIIAPIHFEGQVVMWSATFVHVMDIGAISPGGNSPDAREVEHEGLRVGAMRIVERGELRLALLNVLTGMTRQPEMVGLDIRCQMAANFVARERVHELFARYGSGFLRDFFDESISSARETLRRRLTTLPDCQLREEFILPIAPDDSLRLSCVLTKSGDHVEFDFSGSSDASRLGVNLPRQATFGACAEAVFTTLAADISRNEGVFAPIHLRTRPGSVVDCGYPAPVSLNTTSGGSATKFIVKSLMSRLVAMDARWAERVSAPGFGGRVARHAGQSQHGNYYVSTLHSLRGTGAKWAKSGADCGGLHSTHNVEWLEGNFPLMQLYRRYRRNGAGPGKHRGGMGEESAYQLHDAPAGALRLVAFGTVGPLNSGHGIFGGYPGERSEFLIFDARRSAATLTEIRDDVRNLANPTEVWYEDLTIEPGEVLLQASTCGGGVGDPMWRSTADVLGDFHRGVVDLAGAERDYGVVIFDGRIDEPATLEARAAVRGRRRDAAIEAGWVDSRSAQRDRDCSPADGRCALWEIAPRLPLGSEELPVVRTGARDISLLGASDATAGVHNAVIDLICCPNCWTVIDSRSHVTMMPEGSS